MARKPTSKAAAKPVPEWQQISLRLPTTLVADIDAIATQERRARVKMIETVLAGFVRTYKRRID